MGWSDRLRRLIMLDIETLVAPEYVLAVNNHLSELGFRCGKYGSSGYVNMNPPVDGGTWMALLTNRQPTVLPPGTVGQQWKFGADWDLDVFGQFVYDNCGQGPRRARL